MGKKVYGKKGKSIHFPLFPYTFFPCGKMGKKYMEREGKVFMSFSFHILFPHFSPWEKMGKHTFFHGQKWGWTPQFYRKFTLLTIERTEVIKLLGIKCNYQNLMIIIIIGEMKATRRIGSPK